ncbi:MAG: lipid IV(A) 3-deoxy-D-manno-octulosonic acid transferase [Cocleimonas sp.]
MSLKRSLYTLFLYLIFPLVLLRLLLRSRSNPNYRKRWSERLALVKNNTNKSVIWVHAVSVGEVIAAKPLIEELLDTYSDTPILVTTTTPTGSDRVKALFFDQIQKQQLLHVYFPYDLLGIVSRFIKAYQPQVLIVVETEIWPNLYAKCHQKQIPVLMVNARLSHKSTQSYLKIKSLVAETLSKVNTIAVRSKSDAEKFIQLGAKTSQIEESGNIKYDISIDESQVTQAEKYLKTWNVTDQSKRLVYVAASTHEGEDSKILFTYVNLLKQFPELLLVLVPRHPERFDDVYEQCLEQLPETLNIVRHSENRSHTEDYAGSNNKKINVILGDSMGEMQMWFSAADIVFIGGSLVKTGGHNPLEATLFGVPVVSGPHMFNFEDIATELSVAELLFVCDDEFEISKKLSQILTDKKQLEEQGSEVNLFKEKSERFMQQHRGVTTRLLSIISKLIN